MGRATQGEKAALIQELREEGNPLKCLLKAMGMPKSTYYYELRKEDAVQERNAALAADIAAIYAQHKGRYGVRRVCAELRNRGLAVNHKRIQRLMHQMSLLGKRPKEKYHSYKVPSARLQTTSLPATSAPLHRCRNGQPMSPSSVFLGESAISLRYWI